MCWSTSWCLICHNQHWQGTHGPEAHQWYRQRRAESGPQAPDFHYHHRSGFGSCPGESWQFIQWQKPPTIVGRWKSGNQSACADPHFISSALPFISFPHLKSREMAAGYPFTWLHWLHAVRFRLIFPNRVTAIPPGGAFATPQTWHVAVANSRTIWPGLVLLVRPCCTNG